MSAKKKKKTKTTTTTKTVEYRHEYMFKTWWELSSAFSTRREAEQSAKSRFPENKQRIVKVTTVFEVLP